MAKAESKSHKSKEPNNRKNIEPMLESAVDRIKNSVVDNLDAIETHAHEVCLKQEVVNEVETELSALFQWKAIKAGKNFEMGFPGVVLVAVVGRLLEPTYNPSIAFYDIYSSSPCI